MVTDIKLDTKDTLGADGSLTKGGRERESTILRCQGKKGSYVQIVPLLQTKCCRVQRCKGTCAYVRIYVQLEGGWGKESKSVCICVSGVSGRSSDSLIMAADESG